MEAKILEELDSLELLITPERPRPREMVYADLSKLVYLNAVIKVGIATGILFHMYGNHVDFILGSCSYISLKCEAPIV